MATALKVLPEPTVCPHDAFQVWETFGDTLSGDVLEKGPCEDCRGWFAASFDPRTNHTEYTPLPMHEISLLELHWNATR